MTEQITLTIIKPDAVRNKHTGKILSMIESGGFRISALKMVKMDKQKASAFYQVHQGKPFYDPLIEFMTSGPVVVAIVEKYNAVEEYRKLMGPTDPSEAAPGTIRRHFGNTVRENAVHGSDSLENAIAECNFFFSLEERF